jgi:hypothetical protein
MADAAIDSLDALFVWLIHKFAEEFEDEAILKGGMVLRLLDCPRATNDLDYVLVPYHSKKDVAPRVERILGNLPHEAKVQITMHSTMLRALISIGSVRGQIEVSVAESCKSTPLGTQPLARRVNQLGRIIRVVSHEVALANKLAAWNERRLLRDLYDANFYATTLGVLPDDETLSWRLSHMRSGLPQLKRRRSMSHAAFLAELEEAVRALTDAALDQELGGILAPHELAGLADRMKVGLLRLVQQLQA